MNNEFLKNIGGRCPSCGHLHKAGSACVIGAVPQVRLFTSPNDVVKVEEVEDLEEVENLDKPPTTVLAKKVPVKTAVKGRRVKCSE